MSNQSITNKNSRVEVSDFKSDIIRVQKGGKFHATSQL